MRLKENGMIRKYFPLNFPGLISLGFIIFALYNLHFNLESFIKGGTASLIMIFGYIIIIIFHFLVIFFAFIDRSRVKYINKYGMALILFAVFSFLMIVIQKVMYDEVGRELYMEWPFPTEVNFIYAGLIINAFFIIYALYSFYKAGKAGKKQTSHR